MMWEKIKMKVRLAVQLISRGVAEAIEFCDTKLHLPEFKDSEATVEFLKIFDWAFDLLNTRNRLSKATKKPSASSM